MRLTILLAGALLAPATAHASGGGMGPNWGGAGASAPGRAYTYVALPTERGTLVQAVKREGGAVHRWKHLEGRYGIPQVALDGAMAGLSADGRVLVLSQVPRAYPVRRTRLLVLQATTFRPLGRFSLRGHLSVAALSPHGRHVYLRRYTARNRSQLVALDRGRPGAPRLVAGATAGLPTAHVTDRRWAYTLFQGARSWVQGLDTVTARTRRWSLPGLPGDDVARVRLERRVLRVGNITLTR